MEEYYTSPLRILLGLAAGTFTGAALVVLWLMSSVTDVGYLIEYGPRHAAIYFVYAAVIWALGLVLAAPLPWAIFHRLNIRGWQAAAALGTLLTFLVNIAVLTKGFGAIGSFAFSAADSQGPTWIDGRLTAHGWANALQFAATCAVFGACVGLVVWRVAYRRAKMAVPGGGTR